MYCKHCGKQITVDSTFCQYCGKKQATSSIEELESSSKTEKDEKSEKYSQEVILATKTESPLQVEISKKCHDKSGAIANEIVGNVKMVGLSFAMFVVYILGFAIVHQKDIKKYEYQSHSSYFGESCYDPAILQGGWEFNWERYYYNDLYRLKYGHYDSFGRQASIEQNLAAAEILEKELGLSKDEIDEHRELAKNAAAESQKDWSETINMRRMDGYKDDIKQNAIYASIICLVLCVVGRYFIKLTKWVGRNRTQ